MRVAIVGGGVLGLTIAFRLSQRQVEVTVIDQTEPGRKASWAGAGILPPSNDQDPVHPTDHLQSLSNRLYPELSSELKELTGIDNEFAKCGGIYLARTIGEEAALRGTAELWTEQGIQFDWLDSKSLLEQEPGFAAEMSQQFRAGFFAPGESQLRNPRHLKALIAGCQKQGVEFLPNMTVTRLEPDDRGVTVSWDTGQLRSDNVCLTAGAWTSRLVKKLSQAQVIPIKGHMLRFKLDAPPFQRIINEGNRYIVCRRDGNVLVGSSEEETGWDESVDAVEVDRLKAFARSVSPQLNEENWKDTWTGLRPMAYDHLPYIGPHSRYPRLYLATGHFRSGLHLSPGTAEIICRQMLGESIGFDMAALRPER